MTRNETRNHTPDPAPFSGRKLKQAQAARALTNEAAANEIGVSLRLYQMWRAGDVTPSTGNLLRLSRFYGKRAEWFFEEAA